MIEQIPIKYVFKPDPHSSHSIILSWLEKLPTGSKVLDVGTATGHIGQMLQHKNFNLFGLEPEAEWADKAKPYYNEVRCSDLEHAGDVYLKGYQVVLLADVLEHMAWPDKELKRLVSLQSQGAMFVVSVPNVANIWVRLQLLFGRFDYASRGILDRTHLRFFTRSSFRKLLEDQGLRVCRLQATPIPLSLVNPFFTDNWFGKILTSFVVTLTRIMPTLFGFQWIAQCEVTNNGKSR